jgi:hypothetical protein
MSSVQQKAAGPRPPAVRRVSVTVNEKPVVFQRPDTTGAEIKSTAAAQGVAIQRDFALFAVKDAGLLKQVGDDDLVSLQGQERFRAVAPDDNS